MAKTIQEIISKIQKLLALSKSSNEAEAASAAARAAAMMDEYKIEQATIEAAGGEVEVDPIANEVIVEFGLRKPVWKVDVVSAICKLNGCHSYTSGTNLHVYGRRGDIQTVNYTSRYLWNEIERLTDEEWKKVPLRPESTRSWKNSFRLGCAHRIYKRICDLVDKKEAALKEGVASGSTALIVLAKNSLEVHDGYKKLKKDLGLVSGPRSGKVYRAAYAAGQAAGDSVSLGGSRPQLAAAPAQLKG